MRTVIILLPGLLTTSRGCVPALGAASVCFWGCRTQKVMFWCLTLFCPDYWGFCLVKEEWIVKEKKMEKCKLCLIFNFTKKTCGVGPWLVWFSGWVSSCNLEGHPFNSRAHAWVAGQVPSYVCVRGNQLVVLLNIDVSLSCSFPSLSLKNKLIKKAFKKCVVGWYETQFSFFWNLLWLETGKT